MTFDVTKFLALTAVLAGASIGSAACSSNSNDGDGDKGGSGGSAGSSSGSNAGGENDNGAGSSAYAGETSAPGGAGGSGGAHEGGAAQCEAAGGGACSDTGGATTGGAGAGSGGEGGAEACLVDAAFEGDPCADILDTKCDGAEEDAYNPFYDLCAASSGANMTVRQSFIACLEGDECAETAAASAQACWSTAAAKACPKEGAAAACTTMLGTCTDGGLNQADCIKMLNNYSEALDYIPECLDPNAEGFEDQFVGDCKERLARCTGVPAF